MQTPIKPGKQLVLDLVVHSQGNFRAVRPDLREIGQAHQLNVAAYRFKSDFIRRSAIDRQKHCARLEIKRTAEAKIHGFRRSHGGFGHHQKLPPIRLNAGQTRFALGQRLTHVKGFL